MDYDTPRLVNLGAIANVVLGTDPVTPPVDIPDNGLGRAYDILAGLDE